jgi:hypothetical protein
VKKNLKASENGGCLSCSREWQMNKNKPKLSSNLKAKNKLYFAEYSLLKPDNV